MKSFSTISELVLFQAKNFNNPTALNFKESRFSEKESSSVSENLKSFSNQEFSQKIFHFACGLLEIGLQKNQTIAIFSYQNPIWLIADLGSILAGAITVPIFHNISQENLLHQIADAEIKFIFTDNRDFLTIAKEQNIDSKIITYGFKDENSISFEELILLGQKSSDATKYDFEILAKKSAPQEIATIIYTSGSTSKPKGVELSHQNLISQVQDSGQFFPLTKDDVVFSYLPLAHIFERMVMMYYLSQGLSIYFADDVKNIGKLLREFSPTLMTSVPRMLEKVFARISEGIESANFFKKFLGRKALQRALSKDPAQKQSALDKVFNLLIYKKFRVALGGRMRMIICGGAALSLDLERFYNNIGLNLFCGYGLTEASPVLATNCPKFHLVGTMGKAFPSVELKIASDGELLARGPNIMKNYHNLPQKTAEIFVDGWLKTGDLAVIDKEGFVRITGRKKELFKNANGKYIRPVQIEQKLIQELPFLLGSIVIAEKRKFTSALLFVDFEMIEKLQKKFGFQGEVKEFLRSEILQKFVEEKIAAINKNLDHWEWVQKFKIIEQPISIESGEITPSMKLRRNLLEEKFSEFIEEFYVEEASN